MENYQKYRNYRDMVKARFLELKGAGNFSFRQFSRLAGFRSPNYLQLVIDGERSISSAAVPKFITGLKLEGEAARHFARLVKDELTVKFIKDMYWVEEALKTQVVQGGAA